MVGLKCFLAVLATLCLGSGASWAEEVCLASSPGRATNAPATFNLGDWRGHLASSARAESMVGRQDVKALVSGPSGEGLEVEEIKWDEKMHLVRVGHVLGDPAFGLTTAANYETKLNFRQDLQSWTLTAQLTLSQEIAAGAPDVECVLAVRRPLNDNLQIGCEYFDRPAEGKRYLVPGVYTRRGDVTLNLGLQLGLSPSDDTKGVRSFLTWEF